MAATLLERAHPVWHSHFIRDYHSLIRCGEFETTDHPVGVLCAASTREPAGLDGILRAFKTQAQRARQRRLEAANWDAEVHYYYLLVHDMTGGEAAVRQQQNNQQNNQNEQENPQQTHANEREESSSAAASPPALSASPTLQDARKFLGAVQQLYGSNYCALIKINAVANPQEVKCLDPTPWIEANPMCLDVPSQAAQAAAAQPLAFNRLQGILGKWPNGVAKVTGCFLSPENVAEVKDVMSYYLSMSLFRFLERRLRVLDASVQDSRTTTLSKVANWFKSKEEQKPRVDVHYPTDGSPPYYLASSLEMSMRHCGDLSLFLQDYTGAIDFYKMCLNELMSTAAQRPFNRSMMAGCQEGIGIAYFFLGKLTMPSTTPWFTGGSRAGVKSTHTCRLELALNDYLASGTQTYALRLAFFLYELCRTRSPPAMDRARACLQHVLRSGLTNHNCLFAAIVSDMLATTNLFLNPPYPAGLLASPAGVVSSLASSSAFSMPQGYPVECKLRLYVRFLLEAGARYNEARAPETALRCYLRVLGILRVLGGRGCWEQMYEHVLMTVSRLSFSLGQDIKGLVMASAAVAQSVPLYRNQQNGLENFQLFWDRQAKVLANMGYSLSPHMPMPCIVRSSFQISYNPYFTDDTTQAEGRRLGKQVVEHEWREVESFLRNHFNKEVLRSASYKFPSYHGAIKRDLVFPESSGPGGGVTVTAAGGGGGSVGGGGANHSGKNKCKHYHIAHGEPLWLSFTFYNPVGGAVTANNICILYMSRQKPSQLWKSAATQTVTLEPGARREVDLAFSPLEVGEYVVIGLCWSLLGQEGYYYFATKESRQGCSESLYEYAIEHPAPSLDAEENITVTVAAPRAWVTATLEPPLPSRLHDGEYFHTNLVIKNGGTQEAATSVSLQRSPRNAHLMFLEDFDIARNLRKETALLLAETLHAGESKSFKVTIRAQHDRGDATVKCMNHLFFLIGYVPGDLNAPSAAATTAARALLLSKNNRDFSGNTVRLHRLLRSVEVLPLMALYSTVLPPSNASLASAVVITVKHIATAVVDNADQPRTARNSPALAPSDKQAQRTAKLPVRVSRVMTLHRPQWSVNCAYTGDLAADGAMDCVVLAGSSLTLPLLVRRFPKGDGSAATEKSITRLLAEGVGALATRQPMEDEEAFEDLDSDIEEAEKGNDSTAVSPVYVDEECVPVKVALPCGMKAQALVDNVGAGLAASPLNRYFMRTSFLGAGSVGAALEPQGDALAFYLDKAGQAVETRHEKRMAERRNERRVYGGLLEKYTPLVVAVAWVIDNGPDAPLSSGQLFHFVDPVSFLQQPLATNAFTEEVWEELSGTTASVEHQQHLCECLTKNRMTLATQQGALVYHARVPNQVQTTPTLPSAALVPVMFRCLSLSPVPLLVEVTAASPESIAAAHASSLPLLFVGKSKQSFLLLPSTVHETAFTAMCLIPGTTNCNNFQVRATPLLFQPGLDLFTGLSRSELVRRVRSAVNGSGRADGGGTETSSTPPAVFFSPSAGSYTAANRPHAGPPAQWQQSMGSFTSRLPDDDNDSVAPGGSPGVGTGTFASSFGGSAHNRAPRVAGTSPPQSGRAMSNLSLYTSARGQTSDLLLQLVPRGFHRRRVRVLGGGVPALTEARFLHLGTSTAADDCSGAAPTSTGERVMSYQETSESAFAAKNRKYAADAAAFEIREQLFRQKEEARTNGHHSHTTYVYRPRVRALSPSKISPSLSSSASRVKARRGGEVSRQVAPDSACLQPLKFEEPTLASQAGTTTQESLLDDLFGPAPTAPSATSPAASVSAGATTPSAPVLSAVTVGASPSSSPPLGPQVRVQGLAPLELFMPEVPESAQALCTASGRRQSGLSTAVAVDGAAALPVFSSHPWGSEAARSRADGAEEEPVPFSPILARAPADSLGDTPSRHDGHRKPLQMANPPHLPAHGRSHSLHGEDTHGDWTDSAVGSPVLLPRDVSRAAFPVTEEEEAATVNSPSPNDKSGDPYGSSSTTTTTATTAPSTLPSHTGVNAVGLPIDEAEEEALLMPSAVQQRAVAQRVAAGARAHLRSASHSQTRGSNRNLFATSSSSSFSSASSSSYSASSPEAKRSSKPPATQPL